MRTCLPDSPAGLCGLLPGFAATTVPEMGWAGLSNGALLAAADLAFVSNDIDGALRRLLDTLTRTGGDERESVRARLVEYFELLGPDDPRVGPARRRLAAALF